MLSRQEMFNTAYRAVIAQGERCARYILKKDDKEMFCAVGHLMKGKVEPSSRLWTLFGGINDLRALDDFSELPWKAEHDVFLEAIQDAHDQARQPSSFVSDFKRYMARVADNYSLEIPNV